MRGENRDYIPRRQKGVSDEECAPSEGCAFKAKAEQRDPHFRRKQGKLNQPDVDAMGFPMLSYFD